MDWNQLFRAYNEFGTMFLIVSISVAMIVLVLDSLPAKVKLAEQH